MPIQVNGSDGLFRTGDNASFASAMAWLQGLDARDPTNSSSGLMSGAQSGGCLTPFPAHVVHP